MLLSGEIHYARVPRGLWRDRLLKLRRAGFNAVTTYFFWNFHELSPGVFDFSGERDVDEFIRIASSLGLRLIARVGPYVCAEWDNGGHPDWLISDGLVPRSLHPSYFAYAERWLRAILSKLSGYDQSRGGPLVALQLENEYFWGDIPYHIEMARIARSLGITVDLYTNANRYARNTYFIDSVDLYPDPWKLDHVIWALKDLERTQPGRRPKIMEYEGGWFSKITRPLPTERGSFPASWTRMLLAVALAYGADLISFYMFHGGTNFGYWTGRWITTTYDYEAAIREWGELSERYYKIKSLAQLAYLVDGSDLVSEEDMGGRIKVTRSKGGARFTFYINNTDAEWINEGVRIPPRDVRITATDLPLGSLKISSNLDLLAVTGDTAVFYGDPGEPFWVEVSGGDVRSCYRASHSGARIYGSVEEISGCLVEAVDGLKRILVLSRRLAERTWFTEHYFIVSDAYFIEDADHSKIVAQLLPGRARLYLPLKVGSYIPELGMGLIEVSASAEPPRIEILGVWRGGVRLEEAGLYREPVALEDAGIYQHGVYMYEASSPRRSEAGLAVNDIAIVIDEAGNVSAGYAWWGGEVSEGRVRIYVDSTGHPNDPDWSVTVFKTGLASPLLVGRAGEEEIRSWEHGVVDLSERFPPGVASFNSHSVLVNIDIPNMVGRVRSWGQGLPSATSPLVIHYMRARIDSSGRRHAIIRLRGLRRVAVVMLNGKVIYRGRGNDAFDTAIYAELSEGVNELVIGTPVYGARGEISMPFSDARIEYWERAVEGYKLYRVSEGETPEEAKIPVRVDGPSTIKIRFRVRGGDIAPIYARISGDVVAQVYLNGRMVGHYYDIGSQDRFYLPEPYINYEGENELKLVALPTRRGATLSVEFGAYYVAKRITIPIPQHQAPSSQPQQR